MNQMGCLAAVRSYRAVEVFEALGGFKNMYPLVHYVTQSNLKEALGPAKPAQLLSRIFEILESLLLERPEHIKCVVH